VTATWVWVDGPARPFAGRATVWHTIDERPSPAIRPVDTLNSALVSDQPRSNDGDGQPGLERAAGAVPTTIAGAIVGGIVDAELAALVWLLVEGGLPLVVAGPSTDDAGRLRELLTGAGGSRRAADVAGGVLVADSLAEMLRRAGAAGDLPDDLRDMGVVVVARRLPPFGLRLTSAHYVRPVERDGAGHLQRRPPALLCAWSEATDTYDHFWWGITAELAERAGRPLAEFSAEHARHAQTLGGLAARRAH